MKQSILSNWDLVRFLRLAIGVAILVQAGVTKDWLFGIAGLIFTSMAVFNAGCCGAAGCRTVSSGDEKITNTTKDITYEEVV